MAKVKKAPDSPEVADLKETIARGWISIISLGAFSCLGIWMLIAPESPEHSSIEKGTVYVMKEIWSWQAGAIICVLTLPFIIKALIKVKKFSGIVWTKVENGYYLFDNKKRISGLASVWDNDNLVIFYPEKNLTINLVDYANSPLHSYNKAMPDSSFNCQDAYWNGSKDGYYLYHEGVRLADLSGEYAGEDLIVTSATNGKKFKLANYNSNLDGVTRKAEILS